MAHSQVDSPSVPISPAQGSLRKTAKQVNFHDPLIDLSQPCSTSQPQVLSSLRNTTTSSHEVSFQDPATTINGTKYRRSSPTTSHPISVLKHCIPYMPNLKPKSALKVKLTKMNSPCSTTVVQDIIALKQAFLASFNTTGNISWTYTIRTNPSITPVQHTWRKIPIK